MKKVRYLIILLIILNIPVKILAYGNMVIDKTNVEIIKGSSELINIKLDNAAGRINLDSFNKDIVNVSDESIFLDNNNTNITINGNKVGSTTINIYTYDVTSYDNESLTGKSYKINVTVVDNYIKGDIDGSGIVELLDVISLLKKYLGILPITDDDLSVCDMDMNRTININDVIILLRTYLGLA